jgi:hypothetical protein
VLEYTIKSEWKLEVLNTTVVYTGHVNLLDRIFKYLYQKIKETLLDASKETGPEINAERLYCAAYMLFSSFD